MTLCSPPGPGWKTSCPGRNVIVPHVHTIGRHGPDRVAGFSPIPAMSMVSHAVGARFISLIDSKITVMLRGGYQPLERCRMGTGEFAFAPSGHVFPCERLAAAEPQTHSIGSINGMIRIGPLRDHFASGPPVNAPCVSCGLQPYCVNWCGCSNYFMTGFYNRVSPFLCESEQTLIKLAALIFETLESELGPTFMDHLGGKGLARSVWNREVNGPDASRLGLFTV